jgi:AraC-like DNA-binding protein
MRPVRLSEHELATCFVGTATAPALPHGAGRLRFDRLELTPGVSVTIRRGFLDRPIAIHGSDCGGLEVAFQLGTHRRVSVNGHEVLTERQPVLAAYETAGGHPFEILEEPARDAGFVEFGFAPGTTAVFGEALATALAGLLKEPSAVGSARLASRPLAPELARLAWRMVRPGVNEALRPLALRRDAFALLGLLAATNPDCRADDDRARARRAAEILRARLADPPDLAALARAVGSSKHRLAAAFRHEFAVTPVLFVRAERMGRAAQRLRAGRVPVARLAWELGYRSTSHFVQAFRAWHGVTPARFAEGRGNTEIDTHSS